MDHLVHITWWLQPRACWSAKAKGAERTHQIQAIPPNVYFTARDNIDTIAKPHYKPGVGVFSHTARTTSKTRMAGHIYTSRAVGQVERKALVVPATVVVPGPLCAERRRACFDAATHRPRLAWRGACII